MIPITIVDNFYEDPMSVREYALTQTFSRKNMPWPGTRTDPLSTINPEMHSTFEQKILNLFFNLKTDTIESDFLIEFQLIPEKYEEGWVHVDTGVSFAGVVYLTPGAPTNAGTSIYEDNDPDPKIKHLKPHPQGFELQQKMNFYNDKDVDIDVYRKTRDEHNNQFNKTIDVGNVFNRLVVYPGEYCHRESKMFGTDPTNSRLTQVFFAKIKPINGLWPIERSTHYVKTKI
jgi:hypothetical protein